MINICTRQIKFTTRTYMFEFQFYSRCVSISLWVCYCLGCWTVLTLLGWCPLTHSWNHSHRWFRITCIVHTCSTLSNKYNTFQNFIYLFSHARYLLLYVRCSVLYRLHCVFPIVHNPLSPVALMLQLYHHAFSLFSLLGGGFWGAEYTRARTMETSCARGTDHLNMENTCSTILIILAFMYIVLPLFYNVK